MFFQSLNSSGMKKFLICTYYISNHLPSHFVRARIILTQVTDGFSDQKSFAQIRNANYITSESYQYMYYQALFILRTT